MTRGDKKKKAEREKSEQNRDEIHLEDSYAEDSEKDVCHIMRERGYIHGVVIVQHPLPENDLVSGVVAVAAWISILSSAGTDTCRGVGGKMDQPQRKEKEEKKAKNEKIFPVGCHRERLNCPTILLEESTGTRRTDGGGGENI